VRDLLAKHKIEFDAFRKAVEQDVRFAYITIIEASPPASTASACSRRTSPK
jgi:hypothetical protein